jgi:hypothetical protein
MFKRFLLTTILFLFLVMGPGLVQAQSSLEFSGLAITPFLIEANLEPGVASNQKIVLTNTSDKIIAYDISINDFVPDEASGQVKFLTTGENATLKYSLSSWIRITAQPNFNLKPGESSEIKFQILPPKDAELGTHYGGILFSARQAPNNLSGSTIVEKVGAIILAKIGHAKEQGTIASLYLDTNSQREKNFILEFQNFGNVHLKPKGEIYIHNIFGQQVGDLYVNRDAEIVLPETRREFEALWQPSWFAFGHYTATAVLYYGNPKIEVQQTIGFWILPIKQLLLLLILVGLVIFLVRHGIRRYNNWIIRKAKH